MIVQTTLPAWSSAMREKMGSATNTASATHLRGATHHSVSAAEGRCGVALGNAEGAASAVTNGRRLRAEGAPGAGALAPGCGPPRVSVHWSLCMRLLLCA